MPHLSHSQLAMFARCPEQYRRRYIEGEVIPPGIAQATGSAVHTGAAANFRQKIESHADLPADEIVEQAVEAWHGNVHAGIMLNVEEAERPRAAIDEATDRVAAFARLHAEQQAPDYQPTVVERPVAIETQVGPLLAIIDLIDDRKRVVDLKTGARLKNQGDADTSLQLTIYAAAHQALIGELPESLRLDCLADGGKRKAFDTTRDAADLIALGNRVVAVKTAIEAGSFTPAPPDAWWCSAKWCGYHSTCPYVRRK